MADLGFSTTVPGELAQVKERVAEALKVEGFGVLTQIDVKATLAEKIGAVIDPYQILGACNPNLAHKALQADPEIGLLLPCNVVLREVAGGTEVKIIDPRAMFGVVDGPVRETLEPVVQEARARLERVTAALRG